VQFILQAVFTYRSLFLWYKRTYSRNLKKSKR
jgi:hypothetical protein